MKTNRALTLIELLVVIAIIAILAALLLPTLNAANNKGQQAFCLNNMKQLALATHLYVDDNDQTYPLMWTGGERAGTWRPALYPYVSNQPKAYDCPSEKKERYVKVDIAIRGQFAGAKEMAIASGIGAVNVHWQPIGGPQPPFSFPGNECRSSMVEDASELILFGDGHSDVGGWPPIWRWWIWKEPRPRNGPGFNRTDQRGPKLNTDPGALRHNNRSDYAFADGSAQTLDPTKIPCDRNRCWWSAPVDPH